MSAIDGWRVAKPRCQFGLAPQHFGLLRAQRRDRLRLDRFGDRARVGLAAAQRVDLVEARFCFVGFRAGGGKLVGQFGELLFVDELAARADDAVRGLVGFRCGFRLRTRSFSSCRRPDSASVARRAIVVRDAAWSSSIL